MHLRLAGAAVCVFMSELWARAGKGRFGSFTKSRFEFEEAEVSKARPATECYNNEISMVCFFMFFKPDKMMPVINNINILHQ